MRADELTDALRQAAESTPTPDRAAARDGVARRVRRRRSRQLLAVAAVAVVMLGLGLLLAHTRGDDEGRVVTGLDEVPRLVPTFVPDVVGLSQITELPYRPTSDADAAGTQPSYVTIYATGAPGDELGGSSFGVSLTRMWPSSPETTAFVEGDVEMSTAPGGFRRATKAVSPGIVVAVVSRQMADADLRAVAASVNVGSDGTTIRSIDAPDGYRAVVTNHQSGIFGYSGTMASLSATGYVVSWISPGSTDSQSRYVLLSVTRDDQAGLDILRWSLTDPSTVEIQGHPAVMGSLDGGVSLGDTADGSGPITYGPRSWVISWRIDDRTLVTIEAIGGLPEPGCGGDCTSAVLQRVARSMQSVSGSQWTAFVSSTTIPDTIPDCRSVQLGDGQACYSSDTAVPIEPASVPGAPGG